MRRFNFIGTSSSSSKFPAAAVNCFPSSSSSSYYFASIPSNLNRKSSSALFCFPSSSSSSSFVQSISFQSHHYSASRSSSTTSSSNTTSTTTTMSSHFDDVTRSPNLGMRQHTPGLNPSYIHSRNATTHASNAHHNNTTSENQNYPNNTNNTPPPTMNHQHQQKPSRTKFMLIVGGVCSSLGKGVTTSSIGALLRGVGFRVSSIKIDPYINVDAGLMSPFEHGEVYVLNDGGEVDLDLGNYERWVGLKLGRDHNITTGKVYNTLIKKEREGGFLGKTVQVVPHFTGYVQEHIKRVSQIPTDESGERPDICLIELGGTVGDIESAPFIEALRQLRFSLPPEDFLVGLVTYLPFMGGGQKTKPTQHSAKTLMSLGIIADFLFCRSEKVIDEDAKKKLAQLVGTKEKYIFSAHNVQNLYQIPVLFHEQHVVEAILHKFQLAPKRYDTPAGPNKTSKLDFPSAPNTPGEDNNNQKQQQQDSTSSNNDTPLPPPLDLSFPTVSEWAEFARRAANPTKTVRIAFVGKYVKGGTDAYFSVLQAFEHCGIQLQVKVDCLMLDPTLLEADQQSDEAIKTREEVKKMDGIFVPGGFGLRAFAGKVEAARIARENKIPFFGVCYGFQAALVDIAKRKLGLEDANSEETDVEKTSKNHILRYMPEIDRSTMGANMRLGGKDVFLCAPPPLPDAAEQKKLEQELYPSLLKPSYLDRMYGNVSRVVERHRHRYEFNRKYLEDFQRVGVRFSGASDPQYSEEVRVEAMELPTEMHPYFVATQYHPEFLSNAYDPSPPFLSFVAAVAKMDMPACLSRPTSRQPNKRGPSVDGAAARQQ